MSKKTKIILSLIIVALLAIIAVLVVAILKPNTKEKDNANPIRITIKFDSDGGSNVENITFEKGESIALPKCEKEGYTFIGWYDEDAEYKDTKEIEKDITLTARWEKVKEPDKPEVKEVTMKVTFDSNGGSKVNSMTFKCDNNVATIKNLPKPTKDFYVFLSWEDKNGKSILDGAKIMCDGSSLKLYAVWEYDGPVANPEQKPEDSKTYKCPEGYELKDTNKCVSTKSPEYYCESGKESNGTGSKICYLWAGNPTTTTCKNGGTYIKRDHSDDLCGYEEVTRLTGNATGCTNEAHGTMINNHCYKRIEMATESILSHTCPGTSAYRTSVELGNTANSGCYNLSQRTYGCKKAGDGYSMNWTTGKCVKTIDATLE
jgi:uncharacterized repeat protein (TIGR02543 family)